MFTMLAASKMNGGRDRLHELSGTPPLSFTAKGKPLTAWSINGNTVQNGTPTPENPVEVQAVGDRTANLFDYSTIRTGYRIIWATGTDYADNTAMMSDYIKVKNTTYSCSNKAIIICYDGNKNYLGALNKSMVVKKEVGIFYDMFTINDNECKFIKLLAYQGFVIGNKTMLNEGSTALPYEPYGYKIPVVARGKNLLEPIGFSAQAITNINDYRGKTNTYGTSLSTIYGGSVLVTQANQSGNTTSYTNGFFYIAVDFSKFTTGKNYILSFDYEIKEKHSELVNSIAYIGKVTNFVTIDGDWSKDGRKSVTFTVKEGFNPYIEIRLCGNSIFVSNIQIEEGTTATPYEPYHEPITTPIYLDTPLYKIGKYADSRGMTEEVRVVKELVLTGKEDWYYMPNYDVENTVRIHSMAILQGIKATMLELCSHFEHMNYSSLNVANKPAFSIANGTQLVFRISKVEGSAATYFKAYLAAQYAAGTPVKVYYAMKTPETKTVEPVEIPTLNGTTVIDVDTAVKPESMTIKYRR